MAYVNPFLTGQLFDPEANRKVGRLIPDGYQTGVLGQAQSFALEQQAKQQAEIAANQQAQQQAQQLQQQIEAEAARQEQLREKEREDAYRLEQDRLTQSRFQQQQDIQQKQFDAQLKLLNQQEAMRQAQQAYVPSQSPYSRSSQVQNNNINWTDLYNRDSLYQQNYQNTMSQLYALKNASLYGNGNTYDNVSRQIANLEYQYAMNPRAYNSSGQALPMANIPVMPGFGSPSLADQYWAAQNAAQQQAQNYWSNGIDGNYYVNWNADW